MSSIESVENVEERKVIAVDFDKTLTTGEGADFWEDDEKEYPNEEVIDWVKEMYHNGHVIIIHTARQWEQASTVESYLVKWNVEYHGLRCNKTGADLYVDDKAENVEKVSNSNEETSVVGKESVSEKKCDICSEKFSTDDNRTVCSKHGAFSTTEKEDEDGEDKYIGEVTFFNDTGGYGFVEAKGLDKEVFFHMEDHDFPEPEEGYKAVFEVEQHEKGPRVEKFHELNTNVYFTKE